MLHALINRIQAGVTPSSASLSLSKYFVLFRHKEDRALRESVFTLDLHRAAVQTLPLVARLIQFLINISGYYSESLPQIRGGARQHIKPILETTVIYFVSGFPATFNIPQAG